MEDMREICRAGLEVYGPALGPHETRSSIFYTLGECYEAELDFDNAIEVSSPSEIGQEAVSVTGPPESIATGPWQAYQGAITYQPPTWPHYQGNMVSFWLALGLAYKRSNRLKEARAAYNRVVPHLAQVRPGKGRDKSKALLLQNMRKLKEREDMFEAAEQVVRGSGGLLQWHFEPNAEALAEEARAQMHVIPWNVALSDTREAVRALRAARASDDTTVTTRGEGAGKARRRREKRQRRREKQRGKAAAASRAGDAEGDNDEAARAAAAAPTAEAAGGAEPAAVEVQECLICCEALDPDDEAEPLAPLPCAHLYHGCCIKEWLATCARKGWGKTCPKCRAECPSFEP
jgi:tetratricopeptide (TPR) repeat protein